MDVALMHAYRKFSYWPVLLHRKPSPMSNDQAVYLIIVNSHPQDDIRTFSVVDLTSEPGSRAHYC